MFWHQIQAIWASHRVHTGSHSVENFPTKRYFSLSSVLRINSFCHFWQAVHIIFNRFSCVLVQMIMGQLRPEAFCLASRAQCSFILRQEYLRGGILCVPVKLQKTVIVLSSRRERQSTLFSTHVARVYAWKRLDERSQFPPQVNTWGVLILSLPAESFSGLGGILIVNWRQGEEAGGTYCLSWVSKLISRFLQFYCV